MSYSYNEASQVATISLNDGKMNAFGFDMMRMVRGPTYKPS
jgi:hypothetical protein